MTDTSSSKQPVRILHAGQEDEGQRLDNYLLRELKGVPKTLIYKLVRKGELRVNKKRCKVNYRLAPGDLVRVPPLRMTDLSLEPPGSSRQQIDARPLSLLLERPGFFVVNKPSGLAVHGGSGQKRGLIEQLRYEHPGEKRLSLVHRLDRGTSGCLMVARKRAELLHLQNLLREKESIEKTYVAIVAGRWDAGVSELRAPLLRSEERADGRFVRVSEQGKPAHTLFKHVASTSRYSVILATPLTGRTHQIRVHAKHLQHPLIGDDKYGDDEVNKLAAKLGIKRLALHALRLSFADASGEAHRVDAPLPDSFLRFCKAAGLSLPDVF